jgi:hypothetical protein
MLSLDGCILQFDGATSSGIWWIGSPDQATAATAGFEPETADVARRMSAGGGSGGQPYPHGTKPQSSGIEPSIPMCGCSSGRLHVRASLAPCRELGIKAFANRSRSTGVMKCPENNSRRSEERRTDDFIEVNGAAQQRNIGLCNLYSGAIVPSGVVQPALVVTELFAAGLLHRDAAIAS